MQDAIAGFLAAPLWAQIAMVICGIAVVTAIIDPPIRRWRYRRRFGEIVRGLGQPPPRSAEWPVTSAVSIDGRAFEIRYLLGQGVRGSSYGGPRGHLLIIATRLAGSHWPRHHVEISRLEGLFSRFVASRGLTGDRSFDERFYVVEDGVPLRDRRLDTPMRQAIARFFDEARVPGLVWIRDGELQFVMHDPWRGVDGPAMRALLQRQTALAVALERTAASGDLSAESRLPPHSQAPTSHSQVRSGRDS